MNQCTRAVLLGFVIVVVVLLVAGPLPHSESTAEQAKLEARLATISKSLLALTQGACVVCVCARET